MRAAKWTGLLIAACAVIACERGGSDQNIVVDNNAAGADIEALPPDESSATPTDELVNGVDDDQAELNETANSL